MSRPGKTPKYRTVFDTLQREIQSGRLGPGDRLPSEAQLERRFGASRITVGRAVRDLQLAGLVERRAGAGSYVKTRSLSDALSFGLLIPDLGDTEIFEPICQGMMASPLARQHALLWGSVTSAAASREERAWHLCRQYIDRRVSGVFFAPLELTSGKDAVNRKIAQALDEAGIPLVLLDRTVGPYPERGTHDLVGIDNRRAGYRITEHLLRSAHPPDCFRRRRTCRGYGRGPGSRLPRGALSVELANQPGAGSASGSNQPRTRQVADGVSSRKGSSAPTTGPRRA